MSEALLSLSDVCLRFGGLLALDRVNLQVKEGTIHGLIGPNGAGKTTLLNVICRIVTPQSGRLQFDGRDLLSLDTERLSQAGIGRTFQNLALVDTATVRTNVLVGLHQKLRMTMFDELVNWPRRNRLAREAAQMADEVLARFRLERHSQTQVGRLSYGQRKMVELARAWISTPRLLLLDEPTAGLNTKEIAELQATLLELRARHGLTILVITHHIEFLVGMADQVTVLDLGHPIMHAPPEQVRDDPRVIAAYIGAEE
ncbi:ABC transporter ATP-binding protein [Paucibacter sp. R3-3]|uniref:ABC transporter ATP-binding protein n=1 Tax=Roseateles agri TaxID=3098619 RepID=A0ABU5DPL4_9BURK|nr:ABC transporter ATP-binding protein [Paucibacter sp. R3-3]MDY0748044.1 ABC transporter ATP-binding protein [Paucibacter sp. R3-3]